jgi:hypothetical protein
MDYCRLRLRRRLDFQNRGDAVLVDLSTARTSVQLAQPGMTPIVLSARSSEGMEHWMALRQVSAVRHDLPLPIHHTA